MGVGVLGDVEVEKEDVERTMRRGADSREGGGRKKTSDDNINRVGGGCREFARGWAGTLFAG